MDFLTFMDWGMKILVPIFVGVLGYFRAELKDLQKENSELRKDVTDANEARQREIARVREEFVSLETLRLTEERLIKYFDTRLGDMMDKINSKLDTVVQLMRKD